MIFSLKLVSSFRFPCIVSPDSSSRFSQIPSMEHSGRFPRFLETVLSSQDETLGRCIFPHGITLCTARARFNLVKERMASKTRARSRYVHIYFKSISAVSLSHYNFFATVLLALQQK